MKKARSWLQERDIPFAFHDYKSAGIERGTLEGWIEQIGWESLLNKSGTTFRKLSEDEKQDLTGDRALELMLEQPSMIKRPVLDVDGRLLTGFDPLAYEMTFGA
jgi:Spx/MgsR family transcriptional regulator